MYTPKPIDTSQVELPEDLVPLTEVLAESTHDNWSAQRIKDGWTYGSTRDDANKYHPCLLPYSDLPDSEKEYDRRTAIETIKTLLSLGYTITKK